MQQAVAVTTDAVENRYTGKYNAAPQVIQLATFFVVKSRMHVVLEICRMSFEPLFLTECRKRVATSAKLVVFLCSVVLRFFMLFSFFSISGDRLASDLSCVVCGVIKLYSFTHLNGTQHFFDGLQA